MGCWVVLVGDGWAFVHIPKCGGTTVRSILKGYEIIETLPMFPDNTVEHGFHWVGSYVYPGSFTFVRHPVDWLCSYWSERNNEVKNNGKIQSSNVVLNRLWTPDINLFLTRVSINSPGYVSSVFSAYTAFAESVYRLEDGIDEVLSTITGRRIVTQQKNRGDIPEINNKARRLVEVSEHKAITRYYE